MSHSTARFSYQLGFAFGAQGVALLSSLVASLVAPKLLSVDSFGYWQLFLLYASYSGLFHLGLNDGMYLITGGANRDQVDKRALGTHFYQSLLFQVIVASGITILALNFATTSERAFVYIAFAAYLVAYNLTSYLGYLFQAIGETVTYSLSVVTSRALFICLTAAFIASPLMNFTLLISFFVIGQYCALLFLIIKGKMFVAVRLLPLRIAVSDYFAKITVGLPLLVANLASLFLLGSIRFIIEMRWDIGTFGKISLLFSMVTFVLMFVNQVSMVLFPRLRRFDAETFLIVFMAMSKFLYSLVPCVFIAFYGAYFIIDFWLDDYAAALPFLALIFPVVVFNFVFDLLYKTYFKVQRKERQLFLLNIGCLVLTIVVGALGAFVLSNLWVTVGVVTVVSGVRLGVAHWMSRRLVTSKEGWHILTPFVFALLLLIGYFTLGIYGSIGIMGCGFLGFVVMFGKDIFRSFRKLRQLTSVR